MTRSLQFALILSILFANPAPAQNFDSRWAGIWRAVEILCDPDVRECPPSNAGPRQETMLVLPNRFLPPVGVACENPRYLLNPTELRRLRPNLPPPADIVPFSGHFVFAGEIRCEGDERVWFAVIDSLFAILMSDGDENIYLLSRRHAFNNPG